MCLTSWRFHLAACVKGHETLKLITPPFGHFSPQQENRSFLIFFNSFHDAMPIFRQSIKHYATWRRINLQCIIRISLRWCVSLKIMAKWFHESFLLKPLTYTHHHISVFAGTFLDNTTLPICLLKHPITQVSIPADHLPRSNRAAIVSSECWTLGSFITQKNMMMHLKCRVIPCINAPSSCKPHWPFCSVLTAETCRVGVLLLPLQFLHEY